MTDLDKLEPDEADGTKDIDESENPAQVVPGSAPDELADVDEGGEGDDDEAPNE